jgi:nicotinate-nucleotide adenylyltransferase
MQQVVPEGAECAVHVPLLPALSAKRAAERDSAVQAVRLVRVTVGVLAGPGLDGPREQAPGYCIPNSLEIAHPLPLRRRHYAVSNPRASRSREMARIGLLGGSFNPAHRGHRAISLHALRALGLDEVWWLVSPGNPLKDEAKDMAPFKARLASAIRMARGARIRISDFEQREGTRYSIDTVRRLKQRFPGDRFIWLMGSDSLPTFHKWRNWRGLAAELPIAVIRRPGYDRLAHAARAMGWLGRFVHPSGQASHWTDWSAPAILFLRLPPDPTSATAIRAQHPNWYRRSASRTPRLLRPGLPLSSRRPLDRTSR